MKDKIYNYLSKTPYWELLVHIIIGSILFLFFIILLITFESMGALIPFITISVLVLGGKFIIKDYERRFKKEYEKDFENDR